jgi:uncharacterized small protein (DUF1192 family)
MITKSNALQSLRPGAEWVLRGDDLEWLDTQQTQPTEAEIQAEITRLQAEYDAKAYARSRAAEYPAIGDQLDALWKGGAAAEEMLAAVMAVKSKYPKPE